MQRSILSFLLLVAVALPLAAQEEPRRSYRIGPRDQIQVRVEELPSLESAQVVGEDGTINLPVVGSLRAQGLTEVELAERLRQRLLAEGLRKATVQVTVSAYRSRPVSILGAVREPGNHFVPGTANLLEMLTSAGGLTENHGNWIYVRRQAENGLSARVQIDISRLIEEADPQVNIPIFAGDTINIPLAREVTIHFLGEVNQPGSLTFRSRQQVTLLTAIARAGGLTEVASHKIRVLRETGGTEREEIAVDYRKILGGKESDIPLEDGDLVVVKESFF
jgi:polysaccharide export outer membrane protein